jgi:gamma-glutamyltranspeptidase
MAVSLFASVASAELSSAARRGMVVSVNKQASDVGLAALKQGGNAVDAAVGRWPRLWPSR